MKINTYPGKRKRRFGEPRKKNDSLRISSYNKDKHSALFIGNSNNWELKNNKPYEIIESDNIWNTDDELHKQGEKKSKGNYRHDYHKCEEYIKIVNEKGKKKFYPLSLFKLQEVRKR